MTPSAETPPIKPHRMWAVVMDTGDVQELAYKRRDAISRWANVTGYSWKTMRQWGYRCIRVKVIADE